ncbi:hypothetical protein T01_2895 [Trichinella spiralis]|uniref:Uncharacterized protein n=1 Tax=Trichinella spiralis TaxID=6334 RepID=A0A0V1AT37_TRISP|nr:hypothetical protein T01_2895 [Trichinella spiralis]
MVQMKSSPIKHRFLSLENYVRAKQHGAFAFLYSFTRRRADAHIDLTNMLTSIIEADLQRAIWTDDLCDSLILILMMRVGDENWLIESVKCLAVGIVGLENWLDDDEKSRRGGVELANCPRSSGGYLSSSTRDCHYLAGLSLLDKRAVLKSLELYKRKPIFYYFIPNRSHENQHSDYNCLLTSAQMNIKLQNA